MKKVPVTRLELVKMAKNFLVEKGINPSFQRIKIFEYFLKESCHPSVSMVYDQLIEEIPSLSRTTVYNTVKLFLDKELLQVVATIDNQTFYDATVMNHAHLKCKKCEKIIDVHPHCREGGELCLLLDENVQGHKIETMQITLNGVCKDCLETK